MSNHPSGRQRGVPGFLLFGALSSARYTSFIDCLRRSDLAILAVDCLPDARVDAPRVDELAIVAPGDAERVVAEVMRWRGRYDILGAFNTIEALVEPAALVCDYLGLPGPGLRAARVCRSKWLQRTYCESMSPPFVGFRANDPIHVFDRFPAILKPSGRRGGSGVVRVSSHDDVTRELHRYDGDELLILEECVPGRDFSIETLVKNGGILYANLTEEREDPLGRANLETGYTLPAQSIGGRAADRAFEVNRAVVERIGFENGLVHAEYKLRPDGESVLIEVAARTPGDGLLSMYELSTGAPLERAVLDVALGRETSYPAPSRLVRQVYFDSAPGRLCGVRVQGADVPAHFPSDPPPPRCRALPGDPGGLREVRVDRFIGDPVGVARAADERVGSIIFDAPDRLALDEYERALMERLRVDTRGGDASA